jgi:ubiquitin-protein ligase
VLYAIFTILYNQNPKSSYNSVMASLYEKNREEFNQNVREWVRNNALNIRK